MIPSTLTGSDKSTLNSIQNGIKTFTYFAFQSGVITLLTHKSITQFTFHISAICTESVICFHCLKEKFPEQHVDSWAVSFTAMCIFDDHSNSAIFDGTVSNIHA